jgi:hypothetical protein
MARPPLKSSKRSHDNIESSESDDGRFSLSRRWLAKPSNDLEGIRIRLNRKLPNEATIISRLLKVAMSGVQAINAMVATPSNDLDGQALASIEKLPNEATIISRLLKMTIGGVESVERTVKPHDSDMREETHAAVETAKRSHTILSRVPRVAIGRVHAVKTLVGRTATTLAQSVLTLHERLRLLDETGQPVYSNEC